MYFSIFLFFLPIFRSVRAHAAPGLVVGRAAETPTPAAFREDYDVVPGNVSADAVVLIGFDGCDPSQTAAIWSGWNQAQKVMDLPALKNGKVDFNTAGALEFLGAPGLTKNRQGDFNGIFKQFATIRPAWFSLGWRLQVRCDDHLNKCPCGAQTEPYAYTSNRDDKTGKARISFCPKYFAADSLPDLVARNKPLPPSIKYDMVAYRNTQGFVWTHELMHIDWVTNAHGRHGNYGPNEHVIDMYITFLNNTNPPIRFRVKAYGVKPAKILARYPASTGDYTIRNADNLACFMISQYVQSQLDNIYPHLPVWDGSQNVAPPGILEASDDSLFIVNGDGSVFINSNSPLAANFTLASEAPLACDLDVDDPVAVTATFTAFVPDSSYPPEYISSLQSWIASESSEPAPTPSSNSSSPYCIPFQDPGRGIDGYCQCNDNQYYSFASGDNICPYTSPGPSSATLDPATVTGTGGVAGGGPTPTPTADPTPVLGERCQPNGPQPICPDGVDMLTYCYCGTNPDCYWAQYKCTWP